MFITKKRYMEVTKKHFNEVGSLQQIINNAYFLLGNKELEDKVLEECKKHDDTYRRSLCLHLLLTHANEIMKDVK